MDNVHQETAELNEMEEMGMDFEHKTRFTAKVSFVDDVGGGAYQTWKALFSFHNESSITVILLFQDKHIYVVTIDSMNSPESIVYLEPFELYINVTSMLVLLAHRTQELFNELRKI